MEFSIIHKEKQYTDEEIRKVIDQYNNRKILMREYTMKRYYEHTANLNSDDPEKKEKAQIFMNKHREQARKQYKEGYKVHREKYYKENKELISARLKYRYYKKQDRMKEFIENDKFIEARKRLKNDDTEKQKAQIRYPELFELNNE